MKRRSNYSLKVARGLVTVGAFAAVAFVCQGCDLANESEEGATAEVRVASLPGGCSVQAAGATERLEDDIGAVASTDTVDPSDGGHPDLSFSHQGQLFGVLLHEGSREYRSAERQTRTEFEQSHNDFTAEGYYLRDFEIVEEGGEPLFSGLWHLGSVEQRLHLGTARQLFLAASGDAASAGLRSTDVETYLVAGERFFAGLWNGSAAHNQLTIDISREQLQVVVQGKRGIVDLESWLVNGERCYMVVHAPVVVSPRVFIGQEDFEFWTTAVQQFDDLYQPVEFEIEDENGVAQYSTSWEPATGASWLLLDNSKSRMGCRLQSLRLGVSGLRPFEYSKCRPWLDRERILGLQDRLTLFDASAAGETPELRTGLEESVALTHNLAFDRQPLQTGLLALHVVDFVVSRRELKSCPYCTPDGLWAVPHHQGVIHDMGSSGPGS